MSFTILFALAQLYNCHLPFVSKPLSQALGMGEKEPA